MDREVGLVCSGGGRSWNLEVVVYFPEAGACLSVQVLCLLDYFEPPGQLGDCGGKKTMEIGVLCRGIECVAVGQWRAFFPSCVTLCRLKRERQQGDGCGGEVTAVEVIHSEFPCGS